MIGSLLVAVMMTAVLATDTPPGWMIGAFIATVWLAEKLNDVQRRGPSCRTWWW